MTSGLSTSEFRANDQPYLLARFFGCLESSVALPADLTPLVIRSGDTIAITTIPLGQGKIAAVHCLPLTRIDLAAASTD
jgi:hypothetical protein